MTGRTERQSTSPVRVLVLGAEWFSRPFVDDLLVGLSERGLAVTLASTASDRQPPKPIQTLRIPSTDRRMLRDPRGVAASLGTLLGAPRGSYQLAARIRRIEPERRDRWRLFVRGLPSVRPDWDVIYLPWVGSLVPYRALVRSGIPLVVSCRGSQINIARHNPLRREQFGVMVDALRHVAVVHCVSSHLAGTVEGLGIDPHRIRVIRPGVDTRVFAPRDTPTVNATLRLVTVGKLHWKKGQEYALLALRRLADRAIPAHLTIVGAGPDRQRLGYTARDLGLTDRVTMRGSLDRAAVRREILGADVFLLPSLTEGISNAALEAMACGRPVVSTTAGGMPEAINDGEDGLLVALRDWAAMADGVERLWSDPEARAAIGRAARRRVERDFDRGDQMEDFCALLQQAARPRDEPDRDTRR